MTVTVLPDCAPARRPGPAFAGSAFPPDKNRSDSTTFRQRKMELLYVADTARWRDAGQVQTILNPIDMLPAKKFRQRKGDMK